MIETRFFGMLGFAMRAGKLIIGTENVTAAMSRRSYVKLVLVPKDASEGTKKKLRTKSEYYSITIREPDVTMDSLGKSLGKLYAPACVAVTDEGFAREIDKAINS